MQRKTNKYFRFDWVTIILFLLLISIGWINILSATQGEEIISFFDLNKSYGKQLIFICFTLLLIPIILSIEANFYKRYSSVIYLISVISLLGLFFVGKNVNGAISWYSIGNITIQPSEFAKFTTALAVAKYISDLQTNIKTFKDQFITLTIISIPALLILLQNDTGSTVVFVSFLFVLFREGIQRIHLLYSSAIFVIALLTLKLELTNAIYCLGLIVFLFTLIFYFLGSKKRFILLKGFSVFLVSILVSISINYTFKKVIPEHQKNRIYIWLNLEKDTEKLREMKQNTLYNLNQSLKAIQSGGLKGKGFSEGTRTTGKFVPSQHTDYIFSTICEEWGFIGSSIVILLFVALLLRIIYLAERQKSQFSRVYGYSVASILFMHFAINIGMVMGLIPTIGIPLPFLSYGGSGLWGFTLLLFIFIKLDSNKINEW